MTTIKLTSSNVSIQFKMNDINTILKKRGLEEKGKVQRFFTNEVDKFSDSYVPFKKGVLKNNKEVGIDYIKYKSPYSRYQYYGKVMVGKAPKSVTNKDLKYNGTPKRGAHWDKRMWADKGKTIVKELERMVGV